jgi:hypothetical protein
VHGQPMMQFGKWIMYPVEVLHESSPKVFKIIIDRRCLFAFDIINGLFVATPQQPGIKCPCCNKTQEQVDMELESRRSDKIGNTMELGELD